MLKLLACFTIPGNMQSKANSRQLVTRPGKNGPAPAFIKSREALAYLDAVRLNVSTDALTGHTGPLLIFVTIYYQSRRSDLDISLLQDALQSEHRTIRGEKYLAWQGVYENDRQLHMIVMRKLVDPANPRAEVSIYELPTNGKSKDPTGPLFELSHEQWVAKLLGQDLDPSPVVNEIWPV